MKDFFNKVSVGHQHFWESTRLGTVFMDVAPALVAAKWMMVNDSLSGAVMSGLGLAAGSVAAYYRSGKKEIESGISSLSNN